LPASCAPPHGDQGRAFSVADAFLESGTTDPTARLGAPDRPARLARSLWRAWIFPSTRSVCLCAAAEALQCFGPADEVVQHPGQHVVLGGSRNELAVVLEVARQAECYL
jgi:hypothetical protein